MKQSLLQTRSHLLTIFVCFSFIFVMGSMGLEAQQNSAGVLNGTVLDPAGRAVENAAVVVKKESSAAVVVKSTTDQQGKFSIPNIAAGNYMI